jgi:hypothetical protein
VLLEEIDCSTAKLGAEPKYHYKDIHRGKRRLRPRNWLWEKGFSVIKRPGWFPVNRGRSTVPFSRLFTKNSQKAQPERKVSMPLQLLTVIVLGLKCGSEMNIAVFGHPMLNKQPLEVHIPVRILCEAVWSRHAVLDGRFYSAQSPPTAAFGRANRFVWRTDAIAVTIQLAAVGFSLVGPVPINNRIARWSLPSLPGDWHVHQHRWDVYHWLRTSGQIIAFVLLTLGLAARQRRWRLSGAPARHDSIHRPVDLGL